MIERITNAETFKRLQTLIDNIGDFRFFAIVVIHKNGLTEYGAVSNDRKDDLLLTN